ncbi:LysR family transcriptional regulator [Bifidobacterium sp. MA2]|uniref:LysR family transcriptional regulator n=1 Tax=Bifidobacterium santillanense TaxID=2809028 RepID=A0ABS5UP06_9BIFI|nr:LysR family transcriptional regulator [Bifidobacterium santillanense]MBT1172646.1 LysR family transcriptional regulator [Bifidobacterium santillanense]
MLNPERLNLLVQLQALKTMRAVADVSRLSVSTVSQQIAALERDVGRPLIERVGRQVRLTPLGNELVDRARPVLNDLREIEDMACSESMEVRGAIRVAAFTSALAPLAAPACAAMKTRFTNLTITLNELEPGRSLPLLDAGQLDIVFSASFASRERKTGTAVSLGRMSLPLLSDRLCAVLPESHPLAGERSVHIEDLADDIWLQEPEGTYLSNHIRTLTDQAGFEPTMAGVISSYPAVLQSVASDFGVAVLPWLATTANVNGISVVPIEPTVARSVSLVTTSSQLSRLAIRQFAETARELAEKLRIPE